MIREPPIFNNSTITTLGRRISFVRLLKIWCSFYYFLLCWRLDMTQDQLDISVWWEWAILDWTFFRCQ